MSEAAGDSVDRRRFLRLAIAGAISGGVALLVLQRESRNPEDCVRVAGCPACEQSAGCGLPRAVQWRETLGLNRQGPEVSHG